MHRGFSALVRQAQEVLQHDPNEVRALIAPPAATIVHRQVELDEQRVQLRRDVATGPCGITRH